VISEIFFGIFLLLYMADGSGDDGKSMTKETARCGGQ